MRHLLLTAVLATTLAAPVGVPAQEATGTTGVLPPGAYDTPPPAEPQPRVRGVIYPARPGPDAPRPLLPAPEAKPATPTPLQASAAPADLPLDARPGQCFARVQSPGRTETYQARVLVAPERKETRILAAVYEDAPVEVLVTPERVERIKIPARYRTVTETVVVKPERVRIERIPARYGTVEERVLVSEGGLQWRPAHTLAGPWPMDPARLRRSPTGEVYCLVEVAPVHRLVQRQVLVEPERAIESRDPPVTRTVTRQVVDQPARTDERVIPAVYRTETRRKLVAPARSETVVLPAQWRTVDKVRQVGPAQLEWREAPCAKALTPDLIRRVQQALAERGYPSGRPDGLWGERSREALERFQRDKGLHAGALTLETLSALGIAV